MFGKQFRKIVADAMKLKRTLQIPGVPNAFAALMAQQTGFKAIYLSGSGVASASYGLPDLGMTTRDEVLEDVRRITRVSKVPLLVDVDTGFGNALNISRTVNEMERLGVAGIHIEDQLSEKRCGHLPNKQIVETEEMVDRIKSAVNARKDPNFVIMARTDAFANEGIDKTINRAHAYVKAGADMLFPDALTSLEEHRKFASAFPNIPVLTNLTEFGKIPMFTIEELGKVGIAMAIYPLSAFRAMNKAALNVYQTILNEGTQKSVIDSMQTRQETYSILDYKKFESIIDELQKKNKK